MTENQEPSLPYRSIKSASGRSVAVAIQADSLNPEAPAKIIASGRGKLAEQILDLAFSKGVKVREDADLAELLATLDLDTPVPSEAIVAVAEILAKVYEANQALATAAARTSSDSKGGQ
ncbi:MAG: EscU/YscU/HrcU family type III secretion system export apparatus switch protein [Alphaproteobacteria bacterium]|nr:EscU/YscU/HrcU family type III secretion system export apparatus switch protein [Alphaproteobacteria bacterium]